MQTLTLVEGPHILFKGANGSITAGIKVRRTEPKTEVEDRGYSRVFNLNTHSLLGCPYGELLGLSDEQYSTLVNECVALEVKEPQ